jgi:hypothetical protein
MEIASNIVGRDEYQRRVVQIVNFLQEVGVDQLLVSYGFGCDCPDDLLYEPTSIPTNQLLEFIQQGTALDYYRLGKDNLHICDENQMLAILLCHESDIHFITENLDSIEKIRVFCSANDWNAREIPNRC